MIDTFTGFILCGVITLLLMYALVLYQMYHPTDSKEAKDGGEANS